MRASFTPPRPPPPRACGLFSIQYLLCLAYVPRDVTLNVCPRMYIYIYTYNMIRVCCCCCCAAACFCVCSPPSRRYSVHWQQGDRRSIILYRSTRNGGVLSSSPSSFSFPPLLPLCGASFLLRSFAIRPRPAFLYTPIYSPLVA